MEDNTGSSTKEGHGCENDTQRTNHDPLKFVTWTFAVSSSLAGLTLANGVSSKDFVCLPYKYMPEDYIIGISDCLCLDSLLWPLLCLIITVITSLFLRYNSVVQPNLKAFRPWYNIKQYFIKIGRFECLIDEHIRKLEGLPKFVYGEYQREKYYRFILYCFTVLVVFIYMITVLPLLLLSYILLNGVLILGAIVDCVLLVLYTMANFARKQVFQDMVHAISCLSMVAALFLFVYYLINIQPNSGKSFENSIFTTESIKVSGSIVHDFKYPVDGDKDKDIDPDRDKDIDPDGDKEIDPDGGEEETDNPPPTVIQEFNIKCNNEHDIILKLDNKLHLLMNEIMNKFGPVSCPPPQPPKDLPKTPSHVGVPK